MEVKKFDIEFSHAGRDFSANCQVSKIAGHHNYPQYRIAVPRRKDHHDIYIFYKTGWENKPFFWYELPGMKEQIAKSIANALIKKEGKV